MDNDKAALDGRGADREPHCDGLLYLPNLQ